MNTDPTEATTPYSATPPVAPPGSQPGPPGGESSAWQMPIGIISIVLGACGLIGGCATTLSPLLVPLFEEFASNVMPPGQPTGMEAIADNVGRTVAGGLLAIGAAGLLLFAGIGICKKRPWGPRLSVKWAIVKMIVVVVTLWLNWAIQQATVDTMRQNPTGPQLGSAYFSVFLIGTIVVGLLWGWAYPIFMLIWMSRAKVRAQIRDTWTA